MIVKKQSIHNVNVQVLTTFELQIPIPLRTQKPFVLQMFTDVASYNASYRLFTGYFNVKIKVKVILRPTVSRPVRLGVRHPSGTRDQFFLLLEIFFRQLRVCYFVAPSLTRGRVSNLLLLLVLASAFPRDSRPYVIVSVLETPPT
jgi:hypothetical protein